MERKPIKFNVEPHGKLTVNGMRLQYKIEDDGYYYFVDFDKLVEIVESQQRIINSFLSKNKDRVSGQSNKQGFVPTARNSEEWK
jgi:hypothetical protein